MWAMHRAYLLSQGLRRAQPECLMEHYDLHSTDTFCSHYFNCVLVACSQGKEWISGQKADSFFLSFQSLIPGMVLNHYIAWKMHYSTQACQPGSKAIWIQSNDTDLFISPLLTLSFSVCLSPLLSSSLFLEMQRTSVTVWNLFWVLHNSHLGGKNQNLLCINQENHRMA